MLSKGSLGVDVEILGYGKQVLNFRYILDLC